MDVWEASSFFVSEMTVNMAIFSTGSSDVSVPLREKAIVNIAYQAVDHDEISVQEGDVVEVVSKTTEEEGWWKVCTCSK